MGSIDPLNPGKRFGFFPSGQLTEARPYSRATICRQRAAPSRFSPNRQPGGGGLGVRHW